MRKGSPFVYSAVKIGIGLPDFTSEGYPVQLPEPITPEFIDYVRRTYKLNWNGIHGWSHWMRVCENGLRLARMNGADQKIVTIFAFTHDMARENDGRDDEHGPRAARRINGVVNEKYFHLTPRELALLLQAVEQHTHGLLQADITVQTCWDADRLDLNRVGIAPSPHRLCTAEARLPEVLAWANARAWSRAER
jgi:uncharacterized protein